MHTCSTGQSDLISEDSYEEQRHLLSLLQENMVKQGESSEMLPWPLQENMDFGRGLTPDQEYIRFPYHLAWFRAHLLEIHYTELWNHFLLYPSLLWQIDCSKKWRKKHTTLCSLQEASTPSYVSPFPLATDLFTLSFQSCCWGNNDSVIGFLSSIKTCSSHRNTTGRHKQAHSHKLIDGRLLVAHAEEI